MRLPRLALEERGCRVNGPLGEVGVANGAPGVNGGVRDGVNGGSHGGVDGVAGVVNAFADARG